MKKIKKNIKYWLNDKWNWLLTFNHPPEVIINATDVFHIATDDQPYFLEVRSRVACNVSLVNLTVSTDAYKNPSYEEQIRRLNEKLLRQKLRTKFLRKPRNYENR